MAGRDFQWILNWKTAAFSRQVPVKIRSKSCTDCVRACHACGGSVDVMTSTALAKDYDLARVSLYARSSERPWAQTSTHVRVRDDISCAIKQWMSAAPCIFRRGITGGTRCSKLLCTSMVRGPISSQRYVSRARRRAVQWPRIELPIGA